MDWSAWAGAEPPSKDQEPLIADIKMTSDITVIVDKDQITLNFVSRYGTFMYKKIPFEKGKKFAASKLKPKMTYEEIERLGFEMN